MRGTEETKQNLGARADGGDQKFYYEATYRLVFLADKIFSACGEAEKSVWAFF
jgi:hypothetical protein